MTPQMLNALAKSAASAAGFDRCGVASVDPIGRADYVRWWLGRGMAGSMDYLHRNLDKRLQPAGLLPDAKSAIVVALSYKQLTPVEPPRPGTADARGKVAMYAWGDDYHDVLREKLRELEQSLRRRLSQPFGIKICVDTAPIIERELAARAGLGWIAKNTLIIDAQLGSFIFLGVMLTTLEIAPDEPIEDHCGSCTACLTACPTQAFIGPYQMDASRCISYLTIEHRGDISKPFQEMMGDWLFGCDICQDVCPHNRKARDTTEPRFAGKTPAPAGRLREVLSWNDDVYRERSRGRALSRAKLGQLKRNAEIALRNVRKES